MKIVFDHIKRIHEKPHHVRKQIAFATATGATAFIALVWLVGNLSTGTFALRDSSFADTVGGTGSGARDARNLAGVSAALDNPKSGPARIEIVDMASSTRSAVQTEQTTIPF